MALKIASESRESFPPARSLHTCHHHEQTFLTANYCFSSLNYCKLSLAMKSKTEPRADSASFHGASQTRGNSSSGWCWVSGKWGEGRLPPTVRRGEKEPSCTNSGRDVHRRTTHTCGEAGRISACPANQRLLWPWLRDEGDGLGWGGETGRWGCGSSSVVIAVSISDF